MWWSFLVASFCSFKAVEATDLQLHCNEPWFQLANAEEYALSEHPLTFAEADRFCKHLGGHVAEMDSEDKYWSLSLHLESHDKGSAWISAENRPEYWSTHYRFYYAEGEPNFSGECLYLSQSNHFLWRDTSCSEEKYALCQIHEEQCHLSMINQGTLNRGHVTCMTVEEKPCTFPFYYSGVKYSNCTTIGDLDGRPWCSTTTDVFGQHVAGTDSWGYCQMDTYFCVMPTCHYCNFHGMRR